MKRLLTLLLVLLLVATSGCVTGQKEPAGALIGAGTGALLGSTIGSGSGRVLATVIGGLAGAVVGQQVGRSLDQVDRIAMRQNVQQALETSRSNVSTAWVNPDTGNSGSVTPTRTFENTEGRYCREYQQTVTVAGEQQQAYGIACRQPDGTWRIVSTAPPATQVQREVHYVYPESYYRPSYFYPYNFYLRFDYYDDHFGFGGHSYSYPYYRQPYYRYPYYKKYPSYKRPYFKSPYYRKHSPKRFKR